MRKSEGIGGGGGRKCGGDVGQRREWGRQR